VHPAHPMSDEFRGWSRPCSSIDAGVLGDSPLRLGLHWVKSLAAALSLRRCRFGVIGSGVRR
jgi:hypothetical protein